MRVLIVNSLYPPIGSGGAERSVAELAEGLVELGFDVAVATLAPPGWRRRGSSSSFEASSAGVRVYRWRPPGPWPFEAREASTGRLRKIRWHLRESYRPSARSFLRSVIAKFGPDVIHTNNIAGFGVAIFREIGAHTWIHTIRDYYLLCPRTTRFKRGGQCGGHCFDCRLFVGIRRLPARCPDEVVGVSASVVDVHRANGLWPDSPTSVVANTPATPSIPRRRVDRIRTIGFIGRVSRAKGAGVLLDALSSPKLRTLSLLLAGSVDDEMAVAVATSTKDGRVREGGVMAADEFYSQVDLVVVPSQWQEPYGRVAPEAGSVGLPVLVSGLGGLPEAVSGAERFAVVDQVGDPEAWRRAIADAITRWRDFDVGGPQARPRTDPPYVEVYRRATARARGRRQAV